MLAITRTMRTIHPPLLLQSVRDQSLQATVAVETDAAFLRRFSGAGWPRDAALLYIVKLMGREWKALLRVPAHGACARQQRGAAVFAGRHSCGPATAPSPTLPTPRSRGCGVLP